MKLCTCTKCGWVSMARTKAEAQAEVDAFNTWFSIQDKETQDCNGSEPSSIKNYCCLFCGGLSFRPFKEGDCPSGVTVNPVVWEPEED